MNKRFLILFTLLTLAMPLAAFAQETGGFVSLTKIENLTFAGNSAELPAFLNSLYMICIGLAAVIGVLQIMRAGVTWMTAGGSHEKIGDAKNLIRDTIIGLILVLAPTIVFSIINPDILKLQIRGLSDLNTDLPPVPGNAADATLWSDTASKREDAKARCDAQKGQTFFTCTNTTTKVARAVPITEACAAGEDGITICRATEQTDIGQCSEYIRVSGPLPKGTICDATKGYVQLNGKACYQDESGVYCGSKYSIDKPPKALGCSVAYGNKADLAFDQTAELCCNKQDAEGIQCEALKNSEGGMTSGLYCSCSYSK